MARLPIQWQTNIVAPDSDYPDGRSKDIPMGTFMGEKTMGDFQQFFFKMLREGGLAANGLPDNEYNGHQYWEALLLVAKGYRTYVVTLTQSGTGAPTINSVMKNEIGNIVWTRNNAGSYSGILANSTPPGLTWCNVGPAFNGLAPAFSFIQQSGFNGVEINTFDLAGNLSDDVLANSPVEIRVYF